MSTRLLVATSTYPRWEDDTHPRFVHDLCARLVARHGVEVVVVAPTSHGAAREEVVDGVLVRRFAYWRDRPGLLRDGPALPTLRAHPSTALQLPTYLAAMALALRRELTGDRPPDVVQAHWLVPQATLAVLAGTRRRARLVATSHGSDVLGLPRAAAPLQRWTLRRVDALTAVSSAVLARARELGLPATTPAAVAPMGVDVERFRPDEGARRTLRAELGLDDDQPLVLFVGRLVHGKGADVLLDAVPALRRRHPRVRVAVVGHGAARAALAARAEALGVADVVSLHGFRPHDELARWYAAADVLAGPTRSEGFGLVYAEALATGCPVVASDLPAIRDVVDAVAVGTLVAPDRAEDLATALSRHLDERRERRRAAVADAPRIAARFSWDAAADRHHEVLVDGR